MDHTRFDLIARRLAARKVSRRTAVAAGGAGLAAALAGAQPLSAQVATPAATPAADGAVTDDVLFVQGFAGGTLAPSAGAAGAYDLTLTGGLGATVYFTDRPERAYGAIPTQRFLDGLGFSPGDPPNAALVMRVGEEDNVAIVELTSPAYDPATGTATYAATALGEFAEAGATLQADPLAPNSLPAEFGAAHLFIDGCSDQTMTCCVTECDPSGDGSQSCECVTKVGDLGRFGFCWLFGEICCAPCKNRGHDYWNGQCNDAFASACEGKCMAYAFNNHCW